MGYLCATFDLPGPLCSRVIPDVTTDKQTSDGQTSDAHHRLMPPPYGSRDIIKFSVSLFRQSAELLLLDA